MSSRRTILPSLLGWPRWKSVLHTRPPLRKVVGTFFFFFFSPSLQLHLDGVLTFPLPATASTTHSSSTSRGRSLLSLICVLDDTNEILVTWNNQLYYYHHKLNSIMCIGHLAFIAHCSDEIDVFQACLKKKVPSRNSFETSSGPSMHATKGDGIICHSALASSSLLTTRTS